MTVNTWEEMLPEWYPADSGTRFRWSVRYDVKWLIAHDTDPGSGKFFLYKIVEETVKDTGEKKTRNEQRGQYESFAEAAKNVR